MNSLVLLGKYRTFKGLCPERFNFYNTCKYPSCQHPILGLIVNDLCYGAAERFVYKKDGRCIKFKFRAVYRFGWTVPLK